MSQSRGESYLTAKPRWDCTLHLRARSDLLETKAENRNLTGRYEIKEKWRWSLKFLCCLPMKVKREEGLLPMTTKDDTRKMAGGPGE